MAKDEQINLRVTKEEKRQLKLDRKNAKAKADSEQPSNTDQVL